MATIKNKRAEAGLRERALLVLNWLRMTYPEAKCALNHRNAYELLVATILSAQCTDVRVNLVAPLLFSVYPDARVLAEAPVADVAEIIKSINFYRNKAKSLVGMAQALVRDHGGQVPKTMEELVLVPGAGRKTANVVLGNAFGINEGVVVDTHVGRLARVLGLTTQGDPVKAEKDLMQLFGQEDWTILSHYLIAHGRAVCVARRPRCGICGLADICPKTGVNTEDG